MTLNWPGLLIIRMTARPGGIAARMYAVIRPCAERTRTSRLILKRSRITVASRSSTSARLPPVSRCVRTAVTKNRASSDGMRVRKRPQRVGQLGAVVLAFVQHLELDAGRRRHLVGRHLQPGRERMAGAHRPRDQVDRFGKLLFEFPNAASWRRT